MAATLSPLFPWLSRIYPQLCRAAPAHALVAVSGVGDPGQEDGRVFRHCKRCINPGMGKTMLAERLPTIMPELELAAALEVSAIHSVAGALTPQRPLVTEPPFCAPHHTATKAAIVGGGSGLVRPGAASLAHHGCLFLDESSDRLYILGTDQSSRRGALREASAQVRAVWTAAAGRWAGGRGWPPGHAVPGVGRPCRVPPHQGCQQTAGTETVRLPVLDCATPDPCDTYALRAADLHRAGCRDRRRRVPVGADLDRFQEAAVPR